MASAPGGARLKCCFCRSRARGLRLAVFSQAALDALRVIRIVSCRPVWQATAYVSLHFSCRVYPPRIRLAPEATSPNSAHQSSQSPNRFPDPGRIFQKPDCCPVTDGGTEIRLIGRSILPSATPTVTTGSARSSPAATDTVSAAETAARQTQWVARFGFRMVLNPHSTPKDAPVSNRIRLRPEGP